MSSFSPNTRLRQKRLADRKVAGLFTLC